MYVKDDEPLPDNLREVISVFIFNMVRSNYPQSQSSMPLSTAKHCLELMDSIYYYGMQSNLLWTIYFMLRTIDDIDITII